MNTFIVVSFIKSPIQNKGNNGDSNDNMINVIAS
jgi:hypothetical protein